MQVAKELLFASLLLHFFFQSKAFLLRLQPSWPTYLDLNYSTAPSEPAWTTQIAFSIHRLACHFAIEHVHPHLFERPTACYQSTWPSLCQQLRQPSSHWQWQQNQQALPRLTCPTNSYICALQTCNCMLFVMESIQAFSQIDAYSMQD